MGGVPCSRSMESRVMGVDDVGVENWMSGRSVGQEGQPRRPGASETRARPVAFILDGTGSFPAGESHDNYLTCILIESL